MDEKSLDVVIYETEKIQKKIIMKILKSLI
jgi:hypothetical protein